MARLRPGLGVPFAVELALDDASAAVVREVWRALAHAGFAFMADSGASPHVSLAIWDEIAPAPMVSALNALAAETPPVPIVFSRVEVFPHCTLAQDIDDAGGLARARAVAERMDLPLVGRLERAGLIEFRPVRVLAARPLSRSSTRRGT